MFGSKAEVLDRLRVQDEVYITLIETKVNKSHGKKKYKDDQTQADTSEVEQIYDGKFERQRPINRELDHGKAVEGYQSDQDEMLVEDEEISHNLWHFSIVGYTSMQVQNAQTHLQTMIDKVRLDMLEHETTLNLILDAREGIDVRLQYCEAWWPNKSDQVVPRLAPSGIMNNPGSFRQECMHHTQLSSIRQSLELALEKIRHRKGYYDFMVRLGSLVLSSKQVPTSKVGETFTKDKFNKEINRNIDLHVKKW